MAFILANVASKLCVRSLEEKFVSLTLGACANQKREKHYPNRPKLRNPTWFTRKNRVLHNDCVSSENREYLQEVVQDRLKAQNESPLAAELTIAPVEWDPKMRRTGVIARKIGIYPMWLKNGKKISTTLLQVLDNHVIRYYGPEEYEPARKSWVPVRTKRACILLGAEAADPNLFTKEYCGLFKNSGVVPKKHLARFYISTEAALPLGTPLNALHYRVGQVVDVRGKTIDRGFQGVMKRHGFKGMPASHGVTKTHRRGGNIGGGGEKARVWPGTKMPGHMGNRYRILKGLKIWRINTKYNVLYVSGQNIPGEINSIVTVYDTLLPLRQPAEALPFPTLLKSDEDLPEDMFDPEIHVFSDPTIEFKE